MDNDVAPPSTVIGGVPAQFDELVSKATARDPASGTRMPLPWARNSTRSPTSWAARVRVPAPRNSAQRLGCPPAHHRAAPAHQGSSPAGPTTGRHRGVHEYRGVSKQFAGIEMSEFHWARQRAENEVLLFWVAAVLVFTGLVAVAAWTVGSNMGGLI